MLLPWSWWRLLLLLGLLPLGGCSRIVVQDIIYKEKHSQEEVAVTTRPHIYYCRSPDMNVFTCWWHPLDNLTDGEQVSYVLTYSNDKGPRHECPDYVTSGPNSCHFDARHTTIWKLYCMNVTAVTARRNYTSAEHCVDVAEIVEMEPPVNLTYTLREAGGDEVGHNALLSWTYPLPSDLQYGWITLQYELQYRRAGELDNWKEKVPLREPQVELLGLPVGDYVVRVRCRSQNSPLWSKWSSELTLSIPARPPTGKLLVRLLVSGVGIAALLVIAFGVIPQRRRIKDFLLPPIPKPRIIGVDSLLLKKGNLDEINSHFSNFHSYRPPNYSEEVWEQVSADDVYLVGRDGDVPAHPADAERVALMVPRDPPPLQLPPPPPLAAATAYHHQQGALTRASYLQSLSHYCLAPPPGDVPPSPWAEVVALPGSDYSAVGPLSAAAPEAAQAHCAATHQDFYTCVQLMNESGEVHLVPCLPPAYCRDFPPPALPPAQEEEEEEKKKRKQAEHQARKSEGERSLPVC
ncbi:prolactin receptor [Nelusetta ayraudi]|uniref:prolactin receptor n=1 Tax=Nelusetta ayraudi TaxID=303726 RepID=UPI003F701C18